MHINFRMIATMIIFGVFSDFLQLLHDFFEMFDTIIADLKGKYTDIKLIRNERALPIFDFQQGRRFESDFILLLKDKNDNNINYQFFIEQKGEHIKKFDKWKENFL